MRIRPASATLATLLLIAGPATADERFARIASDIQQLIAKGEVPSVAVAVAKDDRIIWDGGFGWADRERQIPATPHTPYSLASISKPFTATAVMKLVEAGRVGLDRPANDYLGDARITGRHPERATVRRVLAHTAGLSPYFRMRSEAGGASFDETIARYAIVRRPAGRYLYSNLGYGILERIIERVSHRTYAEFMRRELFEPMRLDATFVADTLPHGAARRYGTTGAPLPFYDVDHRGASSVYGSARDLARFGMLHLFDTGAPGHVLATASIREMQRVQVWTSPSEGYGLGWRIGDPQREFRHVGHTGGMPGVTTALSLYPSERLVVVVLANARSEAVVPLARRLAAAAMPAYAWHLRGARR